MEKFDVAVVGLGAFGSATVWQAARKGAKVIGFEQFEFGHVHGASHDTSRIVRTSYDAPQYVALAKSAYREWRELEQCAGVKLLTVTGGVVLFTNDRPSSSSSVKATDYTASLEANNVPYELLTAQQAKNRWPQFGLSENADVVYTADTGIAHAAKSVMTMQFMARTHGAVLKENTSVIEVVPLAGPDKGVLVKTAQGTFQANKVVLAADAWTNKLLAPLGVHIPLQIMQEQVTYFKPADPAAFEPGNFPVWIAFTEGKTFYGFPTFGEPTIKAARDSSENLMTPEQRTYAHSPELLHELTTFMGGLVPSHRLESLRTVTCQYAITPDRQFVLGPLENHPDIIVGLGAGHGFKFAPVIGRVMAELAINGKTTEDISNFGIPPSQPSLLQGKL
ncbi:hypothetical protein H2204_006816 [Knufia peltigerae]|uniref:sarcosine oxidasee (formaldehyde-forming) n=1 Tax=Knufia peltigerae TaxID=1002370 RepID=A0AA39CW87_9EURO|nr:hypothetical protein H2204_006816 [Knufia peltigerae]